MFTYAKIYSRYSSVKDFTFQTDILELNTEEAQQMINYYRHHTLHQKGVAVSNSVLTNLQSKISSIIQKQGTNGVFIRLSSRSPKDSGFSTNRMHQILSQKLAQIDYNSLSDEEIQNEEFICFFKSQIESLKVITSYSNFADISQISTGTEAMELLLNSERVYEDLQHAFTFLSDLEKVSKSTEKVKLYLISIVTSIRCGEKTL